MTRTAEGERMRRPPNRYLPHTYVLMATTALMLYYRKDAVDAGIRADIVFQGEQHRCPPR